MGFGRIIGYILSIIWILSSLLFLPYSLILIWAPLVIIIVLRRQAKREVRLEEYAKSQAESLQKISNQSRSPIINVNAYEVLDERKNKELDSKDEFWVYVGIVLIILGVIGNLLLIIRKNASKVGGQIMNTTEDVGKKIAGGLGSLLGNASEKLKQGSK
jgi:hypothetical protein